MADQGRLYIHIGTHKTGSSSLQSWLGSIRNRLRGAGFAYFIGEYEPDNHVELFAVPMREGREAFARQKYGIVGNAAELERAQERFRHFSAENDGRDLIVSCEGLSLLRHADELQRFASIVDAGDREVRIILVLRDKADFLESFRKQILKHPDRNLSTDPASLTYVEDDSWLADYDAIKQAWVHQYGPDALLVIDYDARMQAEGDVLPEVLRAMGLPDALVPEPGSVRVNTDSWKARLRRVLRKLGLKV